MKKLPIKIPFAPVEAKLASKIPIGPEWQYEPKWDGFRIIAFRAGKEIELQSKTGRPLTRYFPEVVAALLDLKARRFVLDGELVVPAKGRLSFDDLLRRLHPSPSRIKELSQKHPARLILFDLLVDDKEVPWILRPFAERRKALEAFHATYMDGNKTIQLTRRTRDRSVAEEWLKSTRGNLDGVIAKRVDQAYLSGERAMVKVKALRTADCVVGGFRYAAGKKVVGSLLLGLYHQGLLNHVGFASSMPSAERKSLTRKLEEMIEPPGFTGRTPGGPSRRSTGRSIEWKPLRPELVIEVRYDRFTGGQFRHATKFLRWRVDKSPNECTVEQVIFESKVPVARLLT